LSTREAATEKASTENGNTDLQWVENASIKMQVQICKGEKCRYEMEG